MAASIEAVSAIPVSTRLGRVSIRPIREQDVEATARAAFAAHSTLAARQGHPSEHPSPAFSAGLLSFKLKDPNAFGFVAEQDRKIVGSVFLNRFPSTPVAAIGPLTVDPEAEGSGAGRSLLKAALDRARALSIAQVRLVQSPAHLRSLALYSKAGFDVREPLVLMQGAPTTVSIDGVVRAATDDDIRACEQLCERVHGFVRADEIHASVEQKTAMVVLREGSITGYTTGIGLRGHAVGEMTEDVKALIAASPSIAGPGFFVPTRNGELLCWLLTNGYRALWPAALMSTGAYQDPTAAFLPSIAY
jgi:predicted N-acetyltransferase YhbS